jgi:hypothetical protein
MLRCARPLVAAAACLMAVPAVQAQMTAPRLFPANALRGTFTMVQAPVDARLNDKPARLSPGARIRGENNLLLPSVALIGQTFLVHYTLNQQGDLHDVWILTEPERARQPWPATPQQAASWQFDMAAQTWSRP